MPDYQFHCGANVLVKVNDFPVTEAVGISYNLMDSTIPIYGYSSRLFDAVAPGQAIVQGSLVINFVHHNYLYECIAAGLAGVQTNAAANNLGEERGIQSPLEISPVNISISFSQRYTIDLLSAFFIGRGSTIQIDENVILEEYNFFARELNTRYFTETRS